MLAEIGLSAMGGQRLDRRIADRGGLEREVAAWEEARNGAGATVEWRFTNRDARVKLERLYPATS